MEIIRLSDCAISGDSEAIEFRFGQQRARTPWRITLGTSEARVLAYALLAAAERADRSRPDC
jgi:hypothetical protein